MIILAETAVIADIRWVDQNYIELQRMYPKKYIVAKDQRVIVVAETFRAAYRRAKDLLGEDADFTVERIEIGDLFAYDFKFHNERTD